MKKINLIFVVLSGILLFLIAAAVAVVVASRNRQQPAPLLDVPVAQTPAVVRVKAVERKTEPLYGEPPSWRLVKRQLICYSQAAVTAALHSLKESERVSNCIF